MRVSHDSSGSPIPITVYSDGECETLSTITTNTTTLALGVCAVTPGLGSLNYPPTSCASGQVKPFAFTDTACGNVDDYIFDETEGCWGFGFGRESYAYAAIMLSCDENSPGTPTGYATISVAPVATGGSAPSAIASSSASSLTQSGGADGSAQSQSGWDALSDGAKAGIIHGGLFGAVALYWIVV